MEGRRRVSKRNLPIFCGSNNRKHGRIVIVLVAIVVVVIVVLVALKPWKQDSQVRNR